MHIRMHARLVCQALFNKTIRRSYRFFMAVVLFQLFAVMPRFVNTSVVEASAIVRLTNTTAGLANSSEDGGGSSGSTNGSYVILPPWAVWARIPRETALELDPSASLAFDILLHPNTTSRQATCYKGTNAQANATALS